MKTFCMRKSWIFLLIVIYITVLSFSISFSQNFNSDDFAPYENQAQSYPMQKDPFIAGLLSWFMMGVGQIYVQEYTKGSLFIAANFVDKASLILLISYINNKYAPGTGESIYINWQAFTPGTKFLIISYFGVSRGLKFYNVIDAFRSAQKYNERYLTQKDKKGLSFNMYQDKVSLSYTLRFSTVFSQIE